MSIAAETSEARNAAACAQPPAVVRSAATYWTPSRALGRDRAGRRDDPRAGVAQRIRDRRADALGAAGDERAAAGKLQIEAHGMTSRRAILPRSSRKK